VKTDSTASIQLAGITGVTFVQISAGSPTCAPAGGEAGRTRTGDQGRKTQLDQLVAGGAQVLGQANDTMERVKKLLTDENIDSISASLKNIETITTKLAADDGLIDRATGTMKDLSRASNEFASASESVRHVQHECQSGAGRPVRTARQFAG
jgi:phospholipid/cholesterol/gamma-HCH transport system substrate-binding protein